jgi:hypothetical protein
MAIHTDGRDTCHHLLHTIRVIPYPDSQMEATRVMQVFGFTKIQRLRTIVEIQISAVGALKVVESCLLETIRIAYGSGRSRTRGRLTSFVFQSPTPSGERFARHARSSQNRMGPGGVEPEKDSLRSSFRIRLLWPSSVPRTPRFARRIAIPKMGPGGVEPPISSL